MSTPAVDLTALLRQAYDQARAGDLAGATELCDEILHADTLQPDAWLLRAVLAMRAGKPREALEAARRALSGRPARAAIHALIGDALCELGRSDDALQSYQSALQIDERLPSALYGRGRVLLGLQRHAEAVAALDRLLAVQPNDFEALMSRGRAQFEMKDLPSAQESFQRAVSVRPQEAAAHCNLGAVLLLMLRKDEALSTLDRAVQLAPDFAEAHCHRGQVLRLRASPAQALDSFDRALAIRPGYVDAMIGRSEALRALKRPAEALVGFERARAAQIGCVAAQRGVGDALLDLRRPAEALVAHEAALRLGPERASTLISRANSLRALGRHREALTAYDESLQLDATNTAAWCERGNTQLLMCDREEEAIADFARALQIDPMLPFVCGTLLHRQRNLADWSERVPCATEQEILKAVRTGLPACAPFALLSISDDPAAQLECARTFSRHQFAPTPTQWQRPIYGHDRVRLAYLSPDFREHAVSYLMAGVIEHHDRERFEVSAIALRPPEESVTGIRMRRAFDRFSDVSQLSDRAVVQFMRELEIDIVVDLSGYTEGCRPAILAEGAAPVQVSYLGYPGTMGASYIDYLVADDFLVPADRRRYYSESIVHLPDCFQANDARREVAARHFTRQEEGLPSSATVLCCLNNSHKINPEMFGVWMRILAAAPRTVLWLLGHSPQVRMRLRREAQERGVDPARVLFAERLAYPEHLARLRLADLFLDTTPFNAGTTASDALWAGLPVLTCAGETFAARMAGSLLRAVGLAELITTNLEDYEALAVQLALAPAKLMELRQRLASNRLDAPLFDTRRFTGHLEAAYLEMWRRHERGEAPSDISSGRVSAAAASGSSLRMPSDPDASGAQHARHSGASAAPSEY